MIQQTSTLERKGLPLDLPGQFPQSTKMVHSDVQQVKQAWLEVSMDKWGTPD